MVKKSVPGKDAVCYYCGKNLYRKKGCLSVNRGALFFCSAACFRKSCSSTTND